MLVFWEQPIWLVWRLQYESLCWGMSKILRRVGIKYKQGDQNHHPTTVKTKTKVIYNIILFNAIVTTLWYVKLWKLSPLLKRIVLVLPSPKWIKNLSKNQWHKFTNASFKRFSISITYLFCYKILVICIQVCWQSLWNIIYIYQNNKNPYI